MLLKHLAYNLENNLPGKGVLPESWVQIHGRKCTYTTPQPLVSAYFPCDKQRAEKQKETVSKWNFKNVHSRCACLYKVGWQQISTFNTPHMLLFTFSKISSVVFWTQ